MAAACNCSSATATSSSPGRAGSSPCSAAGRCGSRWPFHAYDLSGSALATSGVVAALVAPGILFGTVAGARSTAGTGRRRSSSATSCSRAQRWPCSSSRTSRGSGSSIRGVFLLELVEQVHGPGGERLPAASRPCRGARRRELAERAEQQPRTPRRAWGGDLGGALRVDGAPPGIMLANSVSFLVAAVLFGADRRFRAPWRQRARYSEAAGRRWRRVWSELHDGLGVVRRSRPVGVVFGVTSITSFGEGIFAVMFAVWVRDVLEGGVPALGLLQTSQAVGGLLGGVVGVLCRGRHAGPERLYGGRPAHLRDLRPRPLQLPAALRRALDRQRADDPRRHPRAPPRRRRARRSCRRTWTTPTSAAGVFGSLGTSSSLLMFVGTLTAGAVGGLLGPIALLNFQGSAYVIAGVFVLLMLAPSRAPLGDPASAVAPVVPWKLIRERRARRRRVQESPDMAARTADTSPEDGWHPARLIPVAGIRGQEEQEKRRHRRSSPWWARCPSSVMPSSGRARRSERPDQDSRRCSSRTVMARYDSRRGLVVWRAARSAGGPSSR